MELWWYFWIPRYSIFSAKAKVVMRYLTVTNLSLSRCMKCLGFDSVTSVTPVNKIYRPTTSKFNIPSRQMRWAGFSGCLTFAKYLCGFSLRNQGHLWGDHHRSSQPLQDVEERGTESSCHQCQRLRYQGNLLLQAYNIITWCCPVIRCRHLMVCFFHSQMWAIYAWL